MTPLSALIDGSIRIESTERIILPAGRFVISDPWVIARPVRIEGAGPELTTVAVARQKPLLARASGVTFNGIRFAPAPAFAGQARLFDNTQTDGEYTDWTFRDCVFDGVDLQFSRIGALQASGVALATGTGISRGVRLERVEVTNCTGAYAIEINGVDDVDIRTCWVHDNGLPDKTAGEGIKVLNGATAVRISSTVSEWNTRDGIDIYSGREVSIVDCDLRDNGHWGLEAKWSGSDVASSLPYRAITRGNRVHGNGSGGLNVAISGIIVEGNHVWDHAGAAAHSIRLGAAFDDVGAATEGIIVRGNHTSGGSYGIVAADAVHRAVIEGNVCRGASLDGIALSAASQDCTVSGNQAWDNGSRGLRVNGSGHRISKNRTQDAGDMYVEAAATDIA